MPNFAIIDPKTRTIRNFACEDYKAAVREAGLSVGAIDFGICAQWPASAANHPLSTLNIIVYEYSLFEGAETDYFALNGKLYNGPAVLFRADAEGETIDLPPGMADHFASEECTHFLWFDSIADIERAIAESRVTRPQTKINGNVIWAWTGKREPRAGS